MAATAAILDFSKKNSCSIPYFFVLNAMAPKWERFGQLDFFRKSKMAAGRPFFTQNIPKTIGVLARAISTYLFNFKTIGQTLLKLSRTQTLRNFAGRGGHLESDMAKKKFLSKTFRICGPKKISKKFDLNWLSY